MNDEVNEQILALQERMRAGEITAEAYMDAVNRLVDPTSVSEHEPNSYVPEPFDEDDPLDIDDLTTADALPPVPDGLTAIYGERESVESPELTKAKQTALIVTLVTVVVIFAVTIFSIIAIWAMIRSSLG